MKLETQFKLKSNLEYLNYLHYHSYWYKTLNRDHTRINDFINEFKTENKLRPVDRINKVIDTMDMISNILSTLK